MEVKLKVSAEKYSSQRTGQVVLSAQASVLLSYSNFSKSHWGKKVILLIQIHESCCCIGCYHMYAAVHWRLMMLMSPQMSRFCAATRGESRPRVWGGGEADDLHPAAGPAGGRRCAHKALSLHVWKPVNANIKTKVFNQIKGLYSTWVRKIYVRSFFKLFW